PEKAIDFLQRGFDLDPLNERLEARLDTVAARHEVWADALTIFDRRIEKLQEFGDTAQRIQLAQRAADTAEEEMKDPSRAFDWTERAYFMTKDHAQAEEFEDGLRRLAELAGDPQQLVRFY